MALVERTTIFQVPLCFFGAAFIYCWNSCIGEVSDFVMWGSPLAALSCIIITLFWRQCSQPSVQRWLMPILGILLSLCSLGIVLRESLDLVFVEVISHVAQVVTAAILLLWCDVYGQLPIEKALVTYAGMQIISFVLNIFLEVLPLSLYPGIAFIVGFFSISCFFESKERIKIFQYDGVFPRAHFQPDSVRGKRLSIKNDLRYSFLISAFLLAFAYGLIRLFTHSENNPLSFGISGLIVFTLLFINSRKSSTYHIFNIAFPLVVFGLVAFVLLGSILFRLPSIFLNTGYALMTLIFVALLSDKSYRFGIPALWSLGIVRAILMIGIFLGSSFGQNASHFIILSFDGTNVSVFVLIVAIIASTILWSYAQFSTDEGSVPANEEGSSFLVTEELQDEQLDPYDLLLQHVDMRCNEIAENYVFTKRETEICKYLALGWSAHRISEELFISEATVKSHVRHIYHKLGIHTRDELKIIIGL